DSCVFFSAENELEQRREIRSRNENNTGRIPHDSPNGNGRASRRKIREKNLDAELSGAIADLSFDVFTAQTGIGERNEHASIAGNLLDSTDDSLRKQSVTRNYRPARRECATRHLPEGILSRFQRLPDAYGR